MRRLQALSAAVLAIVVLGVAAASAIAAHNGNNYAELTGRADPDAAGTAVVNYSEGTGEFNGRITVHDLDPGQTYYFVVRLGTNEATDQLICFGEANDQGTFSCSAQHLALNGFSQAVVEDSAGNDEAGGTFARRGNCRDPDQAGSQCEANAAPGQS